MPSQTQNRKQQTTLEAIAELKAEIKTLRGELSRLEGSILKERLKAVEEALTQNRLLQYASQLQDELDEDIQSLPDSQCKNRSQCIQRFKAASAENLKILKEAKIKDALADLDAQIAKAEQISEKAKGTSCEACHRSLQKKLKREKRALQTIVLVEKSSESQTQGNLNISRLVEDVLEPIANSVRLKILVSTYEGKKSFAKLSQLTGLKGGHLLFHLKKLLDAGLVAQEDNKGDYVVTQRGVEVAKKIFVLQPPEA
jgi:DNA-binding transcriptional ArsR family regulator